MRKYVKPMIVVAAQAAEGVYMLSGGEPVTLEEALHPEEELDTTIAEEPVAEAVEEISEETVRIIISWIIGAILPIIALFMTDMVASNLKTMNADDETKDAPENTEDEPAILAASPEGINDVLSSVISATFLRVKQLKWFEPIAESLYVYVPAFKDSFATSDGYAELFDGPVD